MTPRQPITQVVKKRWSRRDVLTAAPVGAVGAAAVGLAVLGRNHEPVTHHRGTCRFCLMHCGVTTSVRGSRLEKVEGDVESKTRGFICEHGYALRELVHSHERLSLPLVRRQGRFHEVSWADALGEVATRLNAVKAKFGPEAFAIQTGWPLVRHPLVNLLHRLARAFGSPNVASVASLCEASLRMGQALTVGTKYSPDLRKVKSLLLWGANPATTAPLFFHLVASKARTGALVVIDPVRTTLAKEATLHVAIRPGTDGALALGLIRLLVRGGDYDPQMIAAHTEGFDALARLAEAYPVERVAELTSVPVAVIEQLAKLLRTERPLGIWQGLGVEHHENGVQTTRAISSLEVLAGRFDGDHDVKSLVSPVGPSFSTQMLPALYRMRTPEPVPAPVMIKPLGSERFPLYEMYNREAQAEVFADAMLDEKPYPLRALMLWASNALITSSGSTRLAKAIEQLELLVVVDPFLSASAQRADVVLPACSFAESQDIASDDAVASTSLAPLQGQSWADYTILRELAHHLGLGTYFPWETMHQALAAPHVPWMGDASVQPKPETTDPHPRFGTLSGKAEFSSRLLARVGQNPLPEWTPPTHAPTPEYPLRLVSGPRPRARINSQFGPSPSVTARMREPEALIHPQVAARIGLTHGESVDVVAAGGRVTFRAVVTADVHPECVVVPAGWAHANPNVLISELGRDLISGFPSFRSSICRIERHVS